MKIKKPFIIDFLKVWKLTIWEVSTRTVWMVWIFSRASCFNFSCLNTAKSIFSSIFGVLDVFGPEFLTWLGSEGRLRGVFEEKGDGRPDWIGCKHGIMIVNFQMSQTLSAFPFMSLSIFQQRKTIKFCPIKK